MTVWIEYSKPSKKMDSCILENEKSGLKYIYTHADALLNKLSQWNVIARSFIIVYVFVR